MIKLKYIFAVILVAISACVAPDQKQPIEISEKNNFNFIADRFADIQLLRYEVPGFENLPLKEKKLAYFLCQAGLAGRDIFYDQKSAFNLRIRKCIEAVLQHYKGDTTSQSYQYFTLYAKQFFFANGIYHHYSANKISPLFSPTYFDELIRSMPDSVLPLANNATVEDLLNQISPILFDPNFLPKGVNLNAEGDLIMASGTNFYSGVTQAEVKKYYEDLKASNPDNNSLIGVNSFVTKENGNVVEQPYKIGGKYSNAIEKIVYWLAQAITVAENEQQKNVLLLLIKFYQTGSTIDFDNYNIAWVRDTNSRFDAVNGFIEVYQDALQKKGAFESVVSMKDLEGTKRIAAISNQAQWFEDNSPIQNEHKKKSVVGITAKVITVIGECGDAAPSTPIGINLPNNEYVRENFGSKSVSLSNIVAANNFYKSKSPVIDEFAATDAMKVRVKKFGGLAADLHTDMHEVIGHASGKINAGVPSSDITLENFAGILEEARADLVALYYIMDQKLIDIGVMPSLEVGKAQYDSYIMNGLMTQLNRIKLGENLEEAHMQNRQLNALWAYDQGKAENVIEKVVRNGKTYFMVNDYLKLRTLFGKLLREIQRIKSEGDYAAAKKLVQTYAVKIDQGIHKEVIARYQPLNVAPYLGFIQPLLTPVMKNGDIIDIAISYPESFIEQHLFYGREYSFLPPIN
ncbi:MAG: hypothetical protein RIQ89_1316 [Bacteroidota bacterium]|jgi:dipeptidyl-peptidase III